MLTAMTVEVMKRARVKIVRPMMKGCVFVVMMTELMKLDIVMVGECFAEIL